MTYPYASRDLHAEPERYMYAPFQGVALLNAYFDQRRSRVQESETSGVVVDGAAEALRERAAACVAQRPDVVLPAADAPVQTELLLRALIAQHLTGSGGASFRAWLDRFVQRFEVTRRLYEGYEPGLRRGRGESTAVVPYVLLALLLGLHYTSSGQLKYLSTWLKAGDLLSTVAPGTVDGLPPAVIPVLFAAEAACVRALCERHGVYAAR